MVNLLEVFLIAVVVVVFGFYAWYASTVLKKKPVTGAESLVGARGLVSSETISPMGEVNINGVIWRARLKNPSDHLKKGDEIVVNRVDDITLIVDRSNVLREV